MGGGGAGASPPSARKAQRNRRSHAQARAKHRRAAALSNGGGGSAAGDERLPEGKGEDSEDSEDALLGTITVPLVEVRDDSLNAEAQEKEAEGCFLAGCGYDSFILDDYSR